MSRSLAVALVAAAGCFVGMQAPINARLGRQIGSLQAASVSFLVGAGALVLITGLSSGGLSPICQARNAPWWALIGGLLGAFYVTIAILTVRTLGVSGLTATVIAAQLATAVVIDRFGLLGAARQHIGAGRILGLVLLIAGAVLVVRR